MTPRSGAVRTRLLQWCHPQHPVFLLAILLVPMMAVRAYLVLRFGSSSPFWDQWDAELDNLLLPYLRGELHFSQFFAAHNEHRILFTRLVSLGLFAANGNQFDAKVEMLFNIVPYAAALGTMAWVGMRTLVPAARPFLILGIFALASAPFGWENLIAGFQNQFFILALLSLITIWLASADVLDRRRLPAILICSVLALFTMASGIFAAAAAAGLVVYRLLAADIDRRRGVLALLLMLAVTVVGLVTLPAPPHGDTFHARSIGQFLEALRNTLAWPLRPRWISVAVLWLPTISLTLAMLRRALTRQSISRGERFAFAVAGWVLVQAVAMAYSRGTEVHNVVTSRYTDLLAIGVINNLWLVLHACFGNGSRLPSWGRTTVSAVFIGWIALSSFPTFVAAKGSMQERSIAGAMQEKILATYLRDGDLDALRDTPGRFPYPDAERIGHVLSRSDAASIMPIEIRRPLAFPTDHCSGLEHPGAFAGLPNRPQAIGTYLVDGGDANIIDCSSAPVLVKGGRMLYFQGGYGPPGVAATLVGKQHTIELVTQGVTGDRWRPRLLDLPADEYQLHIVDNDPHGWVAVTPPIEAGRLTQFRVVAEERSGPGLYIALVLTLMMLIAAVSGAANRHRETRA